MPHGVVLCLCWSRRYDNRLHNPNAAAAANEIRLVQVAALDDDPVVAAFERTFECAVGVGEARADDRRDGDLLPCVVLKPDAFVRL